MQEDRRQTELMKKAWKNRGKNYSYRKIYVDLIDMVKPSQRTVWPAVRASGCRSATRRRPAFTAANYPVWWITLWICPFAVDVPDRDWVTDIPYLRPREGFVYLFSRRVVGWDVLSRQPSELARQARVTAI